MPSGPKSSACAKRLTSLAVPRPGDQYRPALTKDGVWTTANRQNYYYFDFEQPSANLQAKSLISRSHAKANGEIFYYPGKYRQVGDGETYAQAHATIFVPDADAVALFAALGDGPLTSPETSTASRTAL